jgi:hypothetical protein
MAFRSQWVWRCDDLAQSCGFKSAHLVIDSRMLEVRD